MSAATEVAQPILARPTTAGDGPRAEWVDHAKGIGIALVVVGHVMIGLRNAQLAVPSERFERVLVWIYAFHMPLFFFVAGLFAWTSYRKRGFTAFVADKTKVLLYPYVVWSVIQWTATAALGGHVNRSYDLAALLNIARVPIAHFWFLHALWLCFMVFALIARFRWWTALWAGIAIAAQSLAARGYRGVDTILPEHHLVAFAVGMLAATALLQATRWRLPERAHASRVAFSLAAAAMFVVVGIVTYLTGEPRGLAYAAAAAAGIGGTVLLSIAVAGVPWAGGIALLGRDSMPIYLAHVIFAAGARIVLAQCLHVPTGECTSPSAPPPGSRCR